MSDTKSNADSTENPTVCKEIYRKPNTSTSKDRIGSAGITALVVCPDIDTAKAEATRISTEHRRPVYDRSFKDKGTRVARFTIYIGDVVTNVVVARAHS